MAADWIIVFPRDLSDEVVNDHEPDYQHPVAIHRRRITKFHMLVGEPNSLELMVTGLDLETGEHLEVVDQGNLFYLLLGLPDDKPAFELINKLTATREVAV